MLDSTSIVCMRLQQTGIAATNVGWHKKTNRNFSSMVQLERRQGRPLGRVNKDRFHEERGDKAS